MTRSIALVSACHCVIAISELHTAMYGGGAAWQLSGGPPKVGFEPSVAARTSAIAVPVTSPWGWSPWGWSSQARCLRIL